MAGETIITLIGNLTADPELRFTQSGAAVASFTIASTPRVFDPQSKGWKDGQTLFMRCQLWRTPAENFAQSATKGTRVMASGRLVERSFETREGDKRTVIELQVDEIGTSVKYATVEITRNPAATKQAVATGEAGSADEQWVASEPPEPPADYDQGTFA